MVCWADRVWFGDFICKSGLFVTSAYVAAGYTDGTFRNLKGQETLGKVIGISNTSDVALIRSVAYKDIQPLGIEGAETAVRSLTLEQRK